MESRLSIIDIGCTRRRTLSMFTYDGKKYYYFDMVNPDCIDGVLKNDPRIPEYVDLYNEMAVPLTVGFEECRKDNFGNKDKIIEDCSQYNWR